MWSIVNNLLNWVQGVAHEFITFLPSSPFRAYISHMKDIPFLSTLNWFIPISQIIAITQAWIGAVTIYYIYSIVLRWVKALE